MPDPNLELLEAVARLLEPMLDEVVFVGGCVTGLLITDPASAAPRPTTDVDVIAEVYSYAEYDALSARLRALGLTEDNRGESENSLVNRHDVHRRAYIQDEFGNLLRSAEFINAMPGYLPEDEARLPVLRERLESAAFGA